ncbi:sensor histidine kinase [Zhihengliuella flava]|uniref:histidine kinase n=1 Tax=Zhihengliuella flava TaxID=1285193 RepID=A0A931D9V2_9MICC|nr:histidine kinase [Zhihengliuella flava]MBG6084673.1 signal transduction histidine kinase [Zhihengliuella flava]
MENRPATGTAESVRVSFAELAERRRGPVRRLLHRRPAVGDALVVALYLCVTALGLIAAAPGHALWPLAVVGCVGIALWFRRRAPFAVLSFIAATTLVFMVVDPFHGVISIGLWFALYTAGTKYAARRMIALAVLISAGQVLMMALWVIPHLQGTPHEPHDGIVIGRSEAPILIGVAVLLLAANLLATGIGAVVRANRLHQAELANWGLRVSRLAQTAERNRIAREMHDVVAHSLSVMIALSDGAGVVMEKSPDRARGVLGELSATGRTALRDMRRVIGVLRDDSGAPLHPQPAHSSIPELLEGFRAAGLPLSYTHSGHPLPEDPGLRLTVYRIIQESLTNVLRYGRDVTAVTVECTVTADAVRVRVHDDGRSGEARPQVGAGAGLRGIAERVAIYDGDVTAGPGEQGGWTVDARLAVNAETCPEPGGADPRGGRPRQEPGTEETRGARES